MSRDDCSSMDRPVRGAALVGASKVNSLPFKKTLVGFPAFASARNALRRSSRPGSLGTFTANECPTSSSAFAFRLKRQVVAFGPSPLHRSPRICFGAFIAVNVAVVNEAPQLDFLAMQFARLRAVPGKSVLAERRRSDIVTSLRAASRQPYAGDNQYEAKIFVHALLPFLTSSSWLTDKSLLAADQRGFVADQMRKSAQIRGIFPLNWHAVRAIRVLSVTQLHHLNVLNLAEAQAAPPQGRWVNS